MVSCFVPQTRCVLRTWILIFGTICAGCARVPHIVYCVMCRPGIARKDVCRESGRWSVSCILDTFANLLEFWRFSGFQILTHSFVEEESSHSFASSSDHALDRREITSQSIEEKGIATIRLDLEPRLQIKSKADSRAQQTIAHNKAKMPSFALLSKKAALEIQAPLEIETFVCFE